jgi:chromosome segregation ATPase
MMSFLPFFKNFAAAGGSAITANVTSALVQMAPETASAAQLRTMEDQLDQVGELVTKTQRELADEQTAYDKVNARYTQMMGAAEHLQAEIAAATDPAQKASLEASLAKLVAQIEDVVHELDTDKKEVEATQASLDTLNAAYQEKTTALVNAKGELTRAKNDMERASIEQKRAEQRADAARQIAGLTSNVSSVDTALDVFKQTAQKSRDAAAALDKKATALKGANDATGGDPNIAAAMAAAASTTSTASVADRLAALKR